MRAWDGARGIVTPAGSAADGCRNLYDPRAVLAAGLRYEGIGRGARGRHTEPVRLETPATLRVDAAAG